ncbi:MAG: hypothetical protein QM778_05760 [Myxococcales bacterium]
MSNPVSPRPELEDLSVLVRRGHASHCDEDALQEGLARDATLRIAHQVGLDLDHETSVHSGDEELILRAADAALGSSRAGSKRGRRIWHVAAAAFLVVILSGSGIGAALWVAGMTPWQMPGRTIVAGSGPAKPQAHKPAQRPRVQAEALAPAESPVAVIPAPVVLEEPESHPRPHAARTVDAAELFRAANAARRAGAFGRAKHLYSELLRKAPWADEAQLAHVSLGKLLLSQGQVGRAEREFRRYLEAGGGPLSEEALFNRAECLQRLGRDAEEKLAWRALLGAYPESLYAARAKQRLASDPAASSDLPQP